MVHGGDSFEEKNGVETDYAVEDIQNIEEIQTEEIQWGDLTTWSRIFTPYLEGEPLWLWKVRLKLILGTDGGYLLSGQQRARSGFGGFEYFWGIKLNDSWEIVWDKIIKVPEPEDRWFRYICEGIIERENLILHNISSTKDGGYVVAMRSINWTAGNGVLVWLDSDGNIKKGRIYGTEENNEWFNSVVATDDGGFIAVGGTYFVFHSPVLCSLDDPYVECWCWVPDIWAIKVDSEGEIVWQKAYANLYLPDSHGLGWANVIIKASDEGYIIAGFNSMIIKIDENGELIGIGGANIASDLFSVRQTQDGGYVFAGAVCEDAIYPPYTCNKKMHIFKIDANGKGEWGKVFNSPDNVSGGNIVYDVIPTSDGGFAAVGCTWSSDNGTLDTVILKLDSMGNIEWQKIYGSMNHFFIGSTIHETNDGGYIVGGGYNISDTIGQPTPVYWLMKIDAQGNINGSCPFRVDIESSLSEQRGGSYGISPNDPPYLYLSSTDTNAQSIPFTPREIQSKTEMTIQCGG